MPGGQINDPSSGNGTFLFHSSQQHPRLHLGPLKGFFDLTRCPSRAFDWPRALLSELQIYKEAVDNNVDKDFFGDQTWRCL